MSNPADFKELESFDDREGGWRGAFHQMLWRGPAQHPSHRVKTWPIRSGFSVKCAMICAADFVKCGKPALFRPPGGDANRNFPQPGA